MTYKEFCKLVDEGENPYLLGYDDPELEPHMDRWIAENRDGIERDLDLGSVDWIALSALIAACAFVILFWAQVWHALRSFLS